MNSLNHDNFNRNRRLNDFGIKEPLSITTIEKLNKRCINMEQQTNKPVQTFESGLIKVSVWENKNTSKDGKDYSSFSVTVQRGYKDKEDNWKNTQSLNNADIPKAVLVLNKAFEYINTKKE